MKTIITLTDILLTNDNQDRCYVDQGTELKKSNLNMKVIFDMKKMTAQFIQ